MDRSIPYFACGISALKKEQIGSFRCRLSPDCCTKKAQTSHFSSSSSSADCGLPHAEPSANPTEIIKLQQPVML
jgi:hypothetical protein